MWRARPRKYPQGAVQISKVLKPEVYFRLPQVLWAIFRPNLLLMAFLKSVYAVVIGMEARNLRTRPGFNKH
jgi:hypothetical protein